MSVRQSKESDAIFDLAILQGFSEAEHRSVRRTLEKRRLKPNETFVEEGTEADRVYFLIAGEIAVTLRGSLITFIEAPTVVGLLAVIDGQPRTGTLTAVGAATVLSISKTDMRAFIRESETFADNVLTFIAGELRAAYAKEDAMLRHLEDFFVRPNSRIVPGPYVADPYDVFFFVVRAPAGELRALMPRGVRPIPGLEDCFALTFNFFDRVYTRHPSGKAKAFSYNETTPFIPCLAQGFRPGVFCPELYPDNFLAITIGRELFGFPKRFGLTERRGSKIDFTLDRKLRLRATWDGEEAIDPPTFASSMGRAFAGSNGNELPRQDLIEKVFGVVHRQVPPEFWPPLPVFVRKQIPQAGSLGRGRMDIDQLVEIPFKIFLADGFNVLINPALEEYAELPFRGTCVAAFHFKLAFEFGGATVRRNYRGLVSELTGMAWD